MSGLELDRERARRDTDRSFLVEASAGTGKTTVLTERIVHCVLERGPEGEPVPLSRICAITFTEKAAGEMKVRLREEFEREAAAGGAVGGRAREALADLEGASISTIHAFAVGLLKERPIEAGLDPRFTAIDELHRGLLFQEVWEGWLRLALEERRQPLEQALRAGLRLDSLQSAARTICEHGHVLRALRLPAPPAETEVRRALAEQLERGRGYRGRALTESDKLVAFLSRAIEWLEEPGGVTVPGRPGNKGTAGNWSGGRETVEAVREFVRNVTDLREWHRHLPVKRILHELVLLLTGEFLSAWDQRKRADGVVDFDDMLWHARDLLSASPSVRRDLQRKYSAILVDEFQDTDAVQWEIIRLLATRDGGDSAPGEGGIPPGRLFLVGDPKQSIYRFRGADIETYLQAAAADSTARLGLEPLKLATNYRSVPSILSFIDELFNEVMQPSPGAAYQSGYLPFGALGHRVEASGAPRVYILGDRLPDGSPAGSGRDFAAAEAGAIAGLIASMRGNGEWSVEPRIAAEGPARAPGYRDIAVLLPVLTHADALEDAFREAGIPYVLEGGKFYYARSEVSSAVTVLRAVSNPNDAVALYGALRSIFFGISDEDLLRARFQGIPLDYRSDPPPGSPLDRPFQVLRELHRGRHRRSASETLETLLMQTGAREVLAARGIQSLANLNKLVRTVRSLQGNATFSEVIATMARMDEEEIAESESRILEEQGDAVRVLSIHRAKGLDFPIVIAAGLGIRRRTRASDFLADPHGTRTFGLSLGAGEAGLRTLGWEDLCEAERAREDAELVRLLYVALTRARDRLVLSTYTRGRRSPDSDSWEAGYAGTRLQPLARFLADLPNRAVPPVRFLDPAAIPASMPARARSGEPPEPDLSALLAERYGALRKAVAETPGARSLHRASEADGRAGDEAGEREFARARAVRIGVAFHSVMERIAWDRPADAGVLAREEGLRRRLAGSDIRDLTEMVNRTLGSSLMERMRRSLGAGRRVLRELPYVRPLDPERQGIEEGKIDLLFEEDAGWVLVDYKTDAIPAEEQAPLAGIREKYSAQVNAYRSALEQVGIAVKSAYLLLARTGEAVEADLHNSRAAPSPAE